MKIQKEEANKWMLTKDDNDAPFLKILSDAENDAVESFATAVIEKDAAYTVFSANAMSDKRLYQVEMLRELGII